MTTIFTQDGAAVPATAVQVRDNVVTQIRTPEKDGYSALISTFQILLRL
jgi:large subunit ribosomal protein L3